MTEQTNETPLDLGRLRAVVAEALCPPHHREGWVRHVVGQPTEFGPRRPCVLHATHAEAAVTALAPLIERLERAEATVERVRALADRVRAAAERRGYRPHEEPLFALFEALDAALTGDEQGGEGR